MTSIRRVVLHRRRGVGRSPRPAPCVSRRLARCPLTARSVAFTLFLIAAWAKSAQVPFHTWLPDAMAAPTPISAYLHAAAMVKAGVFLIARLLLAGWALPTGMGLLISIAAARDDVRRRSTFTSSRMI